MSFTKCPCLPTAEPCKNLLTKHTLGDILVMVTIMNKQPSSLTVRQHRMTRQRRVILEEIKKVDTHPTADDIYRVVRGRLPRISLGTVYRNLEILSDEGDIQKLESAGTQRRYDGNPASHTHIRCLQCGRVFDLHEVAAPIIEEVASQVVDFQITGCKLEFTGICPECVIETSATQERG